MRRTLYAIAALVLIAVTACNKEDEDINNVPEKGAVRFKNTSNDRYDFYLDGTKFGDMYGQDSTTFPYIVIGSHIVKAVQTGNVVGGAPIVRQQVVIVRKDSVAIFSFP